MEVGHSMSSLEHIKQQKRNIIHRHARPDNRKGFLQVLTTLGPLAALWWVAVLSTEASYWLTVVVTLLMSLFLVRLFVLMHDCGHGSLFRTAVFNRSFGFVFGVVAGVAQYVWSAHHAYHHATNGNWAKYRGPLAIITTDEYEALSDKQRRGYERARSAWLAPAAGFVYLVFNPRVNWLKGSISFMGYVIKKKIAQPHISIKAHASNFATPYWASAKEYWHIFWNNVALLSLWVLMSWLMGPILFFTVYFFSMSLAGGAGLVLFTVQHNFEHAYASGDDGWDRDTAAIRGTSFLILPRWLNWFTADIAHHHIHHLSAGIPNYCLLRCHKEYEHLFVDVPRLRLSQVPKALKCILWDTRLRRIISIAEYKSAVPAVSYRS
jgi:omega-6 fatty acid desaturase (delta-12 desaturase)